jgi:predicted RecA/RadA family phage recombinase
MDNKISEGKTIKIIAQTNISAGEYVSLGANFGGIALDDAANGEVCVLDVSGVYEIPKATATLTSTYALGAPVSITSGKASVVAIGTGTTTAQIASIAGNVVETANSAATTVKIKLR